MKKLILFVLLLFITVNITAQTDGLSYQAVIINPTTQEIPGVNSSGNIYPNKSLSVRFTISNSSGVEYQEEQTTSTDAYGMINLTIGQGSYLRVPFTDINWDGAQKELKVEINLDGDYKVLSSQPLLYVPYAFHRDLTASGKLSVAGDVGFTSDLEVDGATNLNSSFTINNESPTKLSGTLDVDGVTTLENSLTVNNQSPTVLSGIITVEGATKLNNTLDVQSATKLNNTLTVEGAATLNNNLTVTGQKPTSLTGTLTVDGVSTFNNVLNVNNQKSTLLTGTLAVERATTLENSLTVEGVTTLNNSLDVKNQSPTKLTGTLAVDGATDIKNTLTVEGAATLNNNLTVTGQKPTSLTGTLTVGGISNFNNVLNVNNQSPTKLTGTLAVDGVTDIKNTLTVDDTTNLKSTLTVGGATQINNSLNVTGTTTLEGLDIKVLDIRSDNASFVATFENTNGSNGDGLLIKLGRTHGAWNSGSYLNLQNPMLAAYDDPLNTVKGWLNGGTFSPTDIFALMPQRFQAGAMAQIANGIVDGINDEMGLPYSFPEIAVPSITLWNDVNILNSQTLTSPQVEVCEPTGVLDAIGLPDCVMVPPWAVSVSIPRIYIPGVTLPRIPILPAIPNIIPRIPQIPTVGLPSLTIPNFTFSTPSNSLSKENQYITFEDKDGRRTGTIRAQSTEDFRDNTVLDNVYLLNVMSSFVGIDLLDGIVAGTVEISNLVDSFNKIGVEYSSGHGDYAEWLERIDVSEYLTAGDIVAIKGGKITRDLTDVEQIMVVSHKPIILGNAPELEQEYKGNNIAFMGQVPVKVMGAVQTGDYIVANSEIKGYGVAIHPEAMTAADFRLAVGRSWGNNPAAGPKMINTVVGVHNGDWSIEVKKIQQSQEKLDTKIESLSSKIRRIAQKIKKVNIHERNYASKN